MVDKLGLENVRNFDQLLQKRTMIGYLRTITFMSLLSWYGAGTLYNFLYIFNVLFGTLLIFNSTLTVDLVVCV